MDTTNNKITNKTATNFDRNNSDKKNNEEYKYNKNPNYNNNFNEINYDNYSRIEKVDESLTKLTDKNLFEHPDLSTPTNLYQENKFQNNKDLINYVNSNNIVIDSLNTTNLTGYNPLKINEVSNNFSKIQNIDKKLTNNNYPSKSPSRQFDEISINNDFKMLDKLKSKIKILENKIGEINKGKLI